MPHWVWSNWTDCPKPGKRVKLQNWLYTNAKQTASTMSGTFLYPPTQGMITNIEAPGTWTAQAEDEAEQVSQELWASWNIIVQASQEERERAARVRREHETAKKIANETAEKLLLAHLTPQQRDQYKEHRYFEVFTARNGKVRRYRIAHGYAGNITIFEGERAVERLCIHTAMDIPVADNLLAQKFMLETDEERFLQTANHTRLAA